MKNSKKGFTIVECVVAMMIITMISALAITVFQSTVTATNKSWEQYQTTLMADNALSCFKGSVNIDTFEEHFLDETAPQAGNLNVADHTEISEDVEVETGSYLEYNPETSIMPTPFVTVRAYEDGRVSFFNKSLNLNSDSYSPITTFSYTTENAEQYKNDVHNASYSLDKSGIYTAQQKYKEGEINSITVDYYYNNSSKEHITYTVTYSKVTITRTDSNGNETTVETQPTKIEKEYLEKGWFVKLYDGYGFASSFEFVRFEVWDAVNNKKAQDGDGNYLNLCLIGDGNSDSWKSWSNSNSYFSVNELRIAAVSGTSVPDRPTVLFSKIYSYKDYDDIYDTEPFDWYYLPTYIVDSYNNFSPATNIKSCTPKYDEDTLTYTQYTVNDGHVSEIYYALSGGTNIQLFNDCEMLYQYSGTVGALDDAFSGLPKAFTKIRVYDNGVVKFYDKTSDSVAFTYSYSDMDLFQSDITASLVNGNFGKTRQVWSQTVLRAGSATYTVQRKTDGSYKSEVKVTDTNTTYTINGSSELERYFMSRGLVMYFDENSVDTTNNCFYFYLYDAETGLQHVNDEGLNCYIKVSYNAKSSKTNGDWNKEKGMYFSVNAVQIGYSSATTISGVKSSGCTFEAYSPDGTAFFSSDSKWRGLPSYAYLVCIKKDSDYPYQAFSSTSYSAEYDEYTLKNGTSSIASYTEGADGFILYNPEGTVLFANTEYEAQTSCEVVTNTVASQITGELGLSNTRVYENTTLTQYYRVAGAKSVNSVLFNDTARTITFTDEAGNIAYVFDYSSDSIDIYNSDKGEILNEDGSFHEFYDTTNLITPGNGVLRRGSSDDGGGVFYNLVINESIVFNSYAHIIKVQSANIGDADMFDLKTQVGEENESSITKYYSYIGPNTGFIAKVTYPTDTNFTHVKSSIRVWLMSNTKVTQWLENNNIEGATAVEPVADPTAYCYK